MSNVHEQDKLCTISTNWQNHYIITVNGKGNGSIYMKRVYNVIKEETQTFFHPYIHVLNTIKKEACWHSFRTPHGSWTSGTPRDKLHTHAQLTVI